MNKNQEFFATLEDAKSTSMSNISLNKGRKSSRQTTNTKRPRSNYVVQR